MYETERLMLKPSSVDDAPLFLELMNTPKWLQNIGDRNIHSLEDAKQYVIDKMKPQLDRLGYSNNTIIIKETGEKIGSVGIYDREGLEGVDIGFALLPQFEGKGYGLESALKIMDLAQHKWNIKYISAITTKANIASQKLIKKLGLTFETEVNLPNDPEVLLKYSKTFS